MGHSSQAVGLLVHATQSVFSVPLAARIHEGLVSSNRDKRTLLDKMLGLLDILAIKVPFYFVADAYYAAGKVVNGLLRQGNHLVTRVIQCGSLRSRYAEERPTEKGATQNLRQEDKAQVFARECQIDAAGC